MAEQEPVKNEAQIEIKQSQQDLVFVSAAEESSNYKLPFFKSGSRKKQDTWVISVFVILHLVAFLATMFANNCWRNSHGDCAVKSLGRFSFQPLSENPLLGPSASILDQMGALRRTLLENHHQTWRMFTCLWLHAGLFHLIVNLCSVIFIGIHLEQEFGPLRIGVIYILSAFSGTLMATLFITDRPAIASSGALFGLIGAMLSSLIRNWNLYANKYAALVSIFCVGFINFALGLLPYIDNFANIGGLICGTLLGCVLLFSPKLRSVPYQTKGGGLFEQDLKFSVKLKQKFDKPVLRSVCLVIFTLLFAGGLVTVLHGMNSNKYCSWCQFINCVPSKWWSCSDKVTPCEIMVSEGRLTLTCSDNQNFRIYPFANFTQARIDDMCSLICT